MCIKHRAKGDSDDEDLIIKKRNILVFKSEANSLDKSTFQQFDIVRMSDSVDSLQDKSLNNSFVNSNESHLRRNNSKLKKNSTKSKKQNDHRISDAELNLILNKFVFNVFFILIVFLNVFCLLVLPYFIRQPLVIDDY